MPHWKVSMRSSISNQTSHFGIMGGLYNHKISGRSSANRVTSRLVIPPTAKLGLKFMQKHNLLSVNPSGSGGVGIMKKSAPCHCNLTLKKEVSNIDDILNDADELDSTPLSMDCSGLGPSGNSVNGILYTNKTKESYCCVSGSFHPGTSTDPSGCTDRKKVCGIYSPNSCGIIPCYAKPMINARNRLSSVAINDKIYAIGGVDLATHAQESVEMYNDHSWSIVTPMNTKRSNMGAGVLNGNIYVVGGEASNVFLKSAEVYDPTDSSWSYIKNMSVERYGVGVGVLNGKLYAVGGSKYSNNSSIPLKSAEVYDPLDKSWSPIHEMSLARHGVGVGVLNGKLYAVGGKGGKQTSTPDNDYLSSVEMYNPGTNNWKTVRSMNIARYELRIIALNGMLYAIGGESAKERNDGHEKTVERYDPIQDKWTAMAPMNSISWAPGVCTMNGLIYAMGGVDKNSIDSVAIRSVEVYDPVADVWSNTNP